MPKKTTKTKKVANETIEKNAEELQFADGKIEDKRKLSTDIEEILSLKSRNPFGTANHETFEGDLTEMNLSQMQELAVKASVFPSGNKTSLKNKLRREFKTRFGSSGRIKYISQTEQPLMSPDSDIAKRVIEILKS
jgi:hypothetical protein